MNYRFTRTNPERLFSPVKHQRTLKWSNWGIYSTWYQREEDLDPVILFNRFTLRPEDIDQFLKVFATITRCSSGKLDLFRLSCTEVLEGEYFLQLCCNYVVWESAEHFKQAFNRSELRSSMAELLPNTAMSPHLFKKVAVPGICVDWANNV
jgi:hypothetical protein